MLYVNWARSRRGLQVGIEPPIASVSLRSHLPADLLPGAEPPPHIAQPTIPIATPLVRKPSSLERKSPLEFDLIICALGAFGFTLPIKQWQPGSSSYRIAFINGHAESISQK